AREIREHVAERRAADDHLERSLLRFREQLGVLTRGDVAARARHHHRLAQRSVVAELADPPRAQPPPAAAGTAHAVLDDVSTVSIGIAGLAHRLLHRLDVVGMHDPPNGGVVAIPAESRTAANGKGSWMLVSCGGIEGWSIP